MPEEGGGEQSWASFGVPVIVTNHLYLDGEKDSINLRLADKTTLKFVKGIQFWVGAGKGSGITGKGTVFTSANSSPQEGDWEGIILGDGTSNVLLEDCVVEYAGHAGHAHAAVTWDNIDAKKSKSVKFKNCTFRHNEHAAFHSPDHDCGPNAAADSGNKSEGKPLCRPDK